MCRSIKLLRRADPPPITEEEIRAAALQFIRKVSGFRQPSKTNQAAFDGAVDQVASATSHLLERIASATTGR